MDTESTQQILHLIKDVHDRLGVTVLIITHEMSVVREICTHVTLLEGGKIVQTGSVADVVKAHSSRLAKDLVPPPNVEGEVTLQGKAATVVDIAFTSSPGVPTGSKVMDLVAELRGDIVAGTFETVGTTQVGRLAVGVESTRLDAFIREMENHHIYTEVRA